MFTNLGQRAATMPAPDVVDVGAVRVSRHVLGEPQANPERLTRRRRGVLLDEPAPCGAGRPADERSRREGCSDLRGAVLHIQLRHSGRQSAALPGEEVPQPCRGTSPEAYAWPRRARTGLKNRTMPSKCTSNQRIAQAIVTPRVSSIAMRCGRLRIPTSPYCCGSE
jgi:hypothetical protein